MQKLKVIIFLGLLAPPSLFASSKCEKVFEDSSISEDIIDGEFSVISDNSSKELSVREPGKELAPLSNTNIDRVSDAKRKQQFVALKKVMLNQTNSQGGKIFVNQNKIPKFKLTENIFKILKRFHLNPKVGDPKTRSQRIKIQSKLSYVSTEVTTDKKGNLIKVHKFADKVSDKLTILGLLVEELGTNGLNINKLHIRFITEEKGKQEIVDVPFMYQAHSGHVIHGKSWDDVKDQLDILHYATNIELQGVQDGLTSVAADINNSYMNSNPNEILTFKMFINK